MSIADKLSTIAANVEKVYNQGWNNAYNQTWDEAYDSGYHKGLEDGKAEGGGILEYASRPRQLFYEVDFGGRDEIEIEMPNVGNADISEMFSKAKGYKQLTALFSPGTAYNGYRFIQGLSSGGSTIEELTMIDGMKFSRFDGFAQYCINLITINGRIDLSGCTTASYLNQCFLSCSKLVNVSFIPNSIMLSINFASSKDLSDASIASIINGLSLEASGQTLTVHPNVAARITETDVTDRGWTLAY